MEPDTSLFNCEESSCAGHYAGWYWAQNRGITNADQCGGRGSFQQGCQAYVQQTTNDNSTLITAVSDLVSLSSDTPTLLL